MANMNCIKKLIVGLTIFYCIVTTTACTKEISYEEYLELGIKYLLENNYEEAIVSLELAIEMEPKRPEAYQKLAETYQSQGNISKAIEILVRGYELAEDENLKTYQMMLEDQIEQIKYEEALGIQYASTRVELEDFETLKNVNQLCVSDDTSSLVLFMQSDKFNILCEKVTKDNPLIYFSSNENGEASGTGFGIYMIGSSSVSYCLYYGSYQNGMRVGEGIWIHTDVNAMNAIYVFRGIWSGDKPNGEGIYTYTYTWKGENLSTEEKGILINGLWDGQIMYTNRGIIWPIEVNMGKAVVLGEYKDINGNIRMIFSERALNNEKHSKLSGMRIDGWGIVGFTE